MTVVPIRKAEFDGGTDRFLFDNAPTPIWLEDWTAVEAFCAARKAEGVGDIDELLAADEDLLCHVAGSIIVKAVNQAAVDFVQAPGVEGLLGNLPAQLMNDGSLISLRKQIVAVFEERTSEQHEVAGADFGAEALDAQLNWVAPIADGRPDYANVLVMFWDLKDHKATQRAMQEQVDVLETLLDMSRGIASTFDIDLILQLLIETSIELIGASGAMITLFDTEQRVINKQIVGGVAPMGLTAANAGMIDYAMLEASAAGLAIAKRQTVRVDDLGEQVPETWPAEIRTMLSGYPMIVAPILDDAFVIGTVMIVGFQHTTFANTDEAIARMIATQAGVAIRNAGLYEEMRESHDAARAAHDELKQTQTQLLAAQKMEAIGSLAAGIAHEINTPIQFVSDNTSFVKGSVETLADLAKAQAELLTRLTDHPRLAAEVEEITGRWAAADCDFLIEEMPDALAETIEGANRVTEIVRAMKEFAHPGSSTKETVDVNRVIKATKSVSRNEWKYVARLRLDLDKSIPTVEGFPGPLGQSLLIMFVNAAQALAEHRNVDNDGKGTITVQTSHTDKYVEIRVTDDGPGIPAEIKDRIFEPFFTTKDVGNGSGQGLSIAHSVVVDKHQGEIWVEDGDPGAVFVIRLPIS